MMNSYVVLLRGINVGGKNKISMAELKTRLEEHGFEDVKSYINSGNILLKSKDNNKKVGQEIEALLLDKFKWDSPAIKVLILSHDQLKAVITNKPSGFGDKPDTYYSDAVFLMGIKEDEALAVFAPRDGVDTIWRGKGVIYSQRLGAMRTKSRLNRIVGTPAYQSMTIRSWNTTTKLLALLEAK